MTGTRNSGTSALDMSAAEFRSIGHQLIDRIAEFYESLPARSLTPAKSRSEIVDAIGTGSLPETGTDAGALLAEVAPLIFDNSLHNGHPRFVGYISASAAPLGALADLLAASVNANLAKWELSPVASEIEAQTVRWLAELIDYPGDCGGLMVSGGNSANLHGFIAARQAAAGWDLRREGLYGDPRRLTAYVSNDTHTWIQKAAEMCGLGATSVRWIDCDDQGRIDPAALAARIEEDRREGCQPFLVVGTAGTVGTGAIDPLRELAQFCREQQIWFHIDGAYGALAACLPEAPDDLHALGLADSVTVDPHKWLHNPIEAACILTREPDALSKAFEFRPDYYEFIDDGESGIEYYQHGLQNTRGFRALKVWLGLRAAGIDGYRASMRDDIALARLLHDIVASNPDFEARSLNLSIATFRFAPAAIRGDGEQVAGYLNALNKAIVAEVQASGRAFISNAIVNGDYLLRTCVVNFRTTDEDIRAVVGLIENIGNELDRRMRPAGLAA